MCKQKHVRTQVRTYQNPYFSSRSTELDVQDRELRFSDFRPGLS
jgi:hypothetical protein